jgi:tRNA-specific adenosine deaminase 1
MAAIKALEEVPQHAPGAAVRGRNGYENYGAIRTKPGRADSPPTISFSCSDKIATWSVLGLQGAMLEPLFDPVYLTGVVIGGVHEYGPEGQELRKLIRPEIERAIWGRLEQLEGMLFSLGERLQLTRSTSTKAIPSPETRNHLYFTRLHLLQGCHLGSL